MTPKLPPHPSDDYFRELCREVDRRQAEEDAREDERTKSADER